MIFVRYAFNLNEGVVEERRSRSRIRSLEHFSGHRFLIRARVNTSKGAYERAQLALRDGRAPWVQ